MTGSIDQNENASRYAACPCTGSNIQCPRESWEMVCPAVRSPKGTAGGNGGTRTLQQTVSKRLPKMTHKVDMRVRLTTIRIDGLWIRVEDFSRSLLCAFLLFASHNKAVALTNPRT